MASMEDILLEAIEGKCFQHKLDPFNIIEVQKPEIPNFSSINKYDGSLIVWSPLGKGYSHIKLEEFNHYDEISKTDYNRIQKLHGKGLTKEIEEEVYPKKV